MAFPETPMDCAAPGLVARRMAALPRGEGPVGGGVAARDGDAVGEGEAGIGCVGARGDGQHVAAVAGRAGEGETGRDGALGRTRGQAVERIAATCAADEDGAIHDAVEEVAVCIEVVEERLGRGRVAAGVGVVAVGGRVGCDSLCGIGAVGVG